MNSTFNFEDEIKIFKTAINFFPSDGLNTLNFDNFLKSLIEELKGILNNKIYFKNNFVILVFL